MVPLGVAFVQETTIFREFGPLSGSTMRLAYEVAPKIGNTLSRQTLDGDVRKYFRLGATGLLALRARGFKSWGDNPGFLYFGGNSEMRGYDYLQFVGQNAFFGNAELRFPLIEAMATPIGVLGGVRATFFAGVGGAWLRRPAVQVLDDQGRRSSARSSAIERRPAARSTATAGARRRASGSSTAAPRTASASRPSRSASRVHFDWSWRTLMQQGVGRRRLRPERRQRDVPQAEVHDVDRLRLLTADEAWGSGLELNFP